MNFLKPAYTVVKSIIICLIMLATVVYVGLYVLLSVPSVQQKVKFHVCNELSTLLGGSLNIENIKLLPFSEVIMESVSLASPAGEECASIDEVAAGIDLWTLVSQKRIVFNYAEVIGLDARISQKSEDAHLNIQFLIDALSPKDKTKPPTKFDLRFRNIVIRRSKATFSRPWMMDSIAGDHPFANVSLSGLRMDLSIPVLKNDDFRFDIRGMQCKVEPGVELRNLSAQVRYNKTPSTVADTLSLKNLNIALPASMLSLEDIDIPLGKKLDVAASLKGYLTPSDFATLLPRLSSFESAWNLDLGAHYSGSDLDVEHLVIQNPDFDSSLSLEGNVVGLGMKDSINAEINRFSAQLSKRLISGVCDALPGVNAKLRNMLVGLGSVSVDLSGSVSALDKASLSATVGSESGSLSIDGRAYGLRSRLPHLKASVKGSDVALGKFLASEVLGCTSFSIDADVTGIGKNASGEVDLLADYIEVGGRRINDVDASFVKEGDAFIVSLSNSDDDFSVRAYADATLAGSASSFNSDVVITGFTPALFGIKGKLADCTTSFEVSASGIGNNADNIIGSVDISGLQMVSPEQGTLSLDNLAIRIDGDPSEADNPSGFHRHLTLRSDWVDADASGIVKASEIVPEIKNMLAGIFPALIPLHENEYDKEHIALNDFNFKINLKGVSSPYDFFNIPFSPLSDIPVEGFVNTKAGRVQLGFSTPHIQQSGNKLISDTRFGLSLDSYNGEARISAGTLYPAKKGDVQLALDVKGINDIVNAELRLNPSFKSNLKGSLAMDISFSRSADFFNPNGDLAVHVNILPSAISLSNTVWNVANGKIDYAGKRVAVSNFLVQHASQYVKIDGVASESPYDQLKVKLNDIDLDYIFSVLNINYVTFGGMATGEVVGSRLLTNKPVAFTKFLNVRNLSYNGAVLGNGDLSSDYDAEQQKVGIYAVIKDPLTRERRADIDGGIWVTRDSLSFSFDANKVNLQLMKPFVSAFCSDLNGEGSGRCKLYGTFSDIDLVGNLRADTLSMKLDFTNTWYHAGGDSVFMSKGVIDIPPLTLYDSEGHTAELSGWLRHRYFHEPVFDFRVRNARSLLCYDTNEKINPLWYGTIYASGNAQIAGRPGLVDIDMNMSTDDHSRFYYVISDTEEADGISFLSFTDRRKEQKKSESTDSIPSYLQKFMKKKSDDEEGSSNVIVSLRGSVTPDALVTLVMDPKGGDKITARGNGALQMDYNMVANDLRMIGTYVLEEGNYNFTLQDIIIKNFTIKKGSMLRFDGDPMDAILDIAATYRVNTNLTDLDKSFSSDKELNRTNVPVDALLLVSGPMTHPEIGFDIELPTLTSDVERKVKSIVSTNDMMSRQIIYLLALNRFYTPEYTGASSQSGAEWSSMASSTISSQLSNILSQMTDKLSVAPSFRSDKGDFTDMEFDLALSSRLLNNRLLINGNFGYRDRSTSNTQFVGDFDIEYLLSKNGNLRLKAYNHFNDQNYYLRSALTTQGVGVVLRHDFDRLWRRKSKSKTVKTDADRPSQEEKSDSAKISLDREPIVDKND